MVVQHHPTAQQIRILAARAEQELRSERGQQFDPTLNSNLDFKQFGGRQYYSFFSTYLNVPTWWGVEIEAGYLLNQGYYLTDDDKTPEGGHAYLGIKVPLLQGLITNERRTLVEQARLISSANAQQIRTQLNDLLYAATLQYWAWAAAYQEVDIWQQALELGRQRLDATRIAFQQGDKPAIDTLESYANLLDREMRLQEARLQLLKEQTALDNFLWSPQLAPLQLAPNARPDAMPTNTGIDSVKLNALLGQVGTLHPDLQIYNLQIQHFQLDQKLKRNKILPKLDLKYNFLANQRVDFFAPGAGAFVENYKFGLKFSMPIFLRHSRAELELNKLKIQETRFKQQQKELEIRNKIRNYFAEVATYEQQLALIEQNLQNYRRLLDAEQEKFRLGESSIFLLNSREMKVIEMLQKRLSTLGKLAKAQASLSWAAALLGGE